MVYIWFRLMPGILSIIWCLVFLWDLLESESERALLPSVLAHTRNMGGDVSQANPD